MDRTEEREQARLIRWATSAPVRQLVPQLLYLFHVPNGGLRDKRTAGQMVALGVKRGVLDLLLPCPFGGFHGLAIEFKSPTGTLSPDQSRWIAQLQAWNWSVQVARSASQARDILAAYFTCPELLEIALP